MAKLEELFKKTHPGDVGIIGDPIEHSLSPLMQNAAFQTWWAAFRDRDERTPHYHKFQVKPPDLEKAIVLAKKYRLRGLNVTVPHKVTVCQYLDSLDPFAKKVEAVNTLSFSDKEVRGFNTDGDGFSRSLRNDLNVDVIGKNAFVLGGGGTGRVIVYKLLELGANVSWWNRTFVSLKQTLSKHDSLRAKVSLVESEKEFENAIEESHLIVNATSVGLDPSDGLPAPKMKFHPGQYVFDVIYHRETRMLQEANAQGATVTGGIGMLVHQGARAFEIWTSAPAPREVMWESITKLLKQG